MKPIHCVLPVLAVLAIPAAADPPAAASPWVAQIKVSRGIVRIVRKDQTFPAPVGVRLQVEDTVITGGNGSAGLTFLDNSTLAMGPESEVSLRRFDYDPTTYMGAFDAYVKQGTVSLQPGNLAAGGNDNVHVSTPQADLKGNARQLLVAVEAKK